MSASRRLLLLGALAAVAGGVAALVVALSPGLPDGPEPVAWDREPCAHCRMLVGERAFAAQLIQKDGQVSNFDDPGCLFALLDDRKPAVHRIWLHHLREERWIPKDGVAFELVRTPTPMGFGLGAVDDGTAGAVTWDAAAERVRATRAELGSAP